MKNILGILGGIGPLASAEFLKTIYELNLTDLEQESPVCILYSDPTVPDRTNAIINNSSELLIEYLINAFETLEQLGVNKVVISCITMHYFLPKIPSQMQKKVVSLIDIIIEEVLNTKKQYLLLCTNGTRHAEIFQKHSSWNLCKQYILFPEKNDQDFIHSLIYKIKTGGYYDLFYERYLNSLIEQYQADGFIAGCTEIHLLLNHLAGSKQNNINYSIVDPLLIFAANFRRFIDA